MGCGAEGGAPGINRGREGRLAQGHGAACGGVAGGCGEDDCMLKLLPPSFQKADDTVCL